MSGNEMTHDACQWCSTTWSEFKVPGTIRVCVTYMSFSERLELNVHGVGQTVYGAVQRQTAYHQNQKENVRKGGTDVEHLNRRKMGRNLITKSRFVKRDDPGYDWTRIKAGLHVRRKHKRKHKPPVNRDEASTSTSARSLFLRLKFLLVAS